MNAALSELRDTIWAINKEAVTLNEMEDKVSTLFWRLKLTDSSFNYSLFRARHSAKKLQPLQAVNIFRIIQEAIGNARKHSGGNTVIVGFETDAASKLRLSIADNGKGFDVKVDGGPEQYGLSNMKKRAAEIGAALSIVSQPNTGTTVQVVLAIA